MVLSSSVPDSSSLWNPLPGAELEPEEEGAVALPVFDGKVSSKRYQAKAVKISPIKEMTAELARYGNPSIAP